MPPDNGGYMVAGYIAILLIYMASLWRRAKKVTSSE
jgi:hypothetical protein